MMAKETGQQLPEPWSEDFVRVLRAPFPTDAVGWVVVATTNKLPKDDPNYRECWAPYVEAPHIRDRLDQVAGADGWSVDLEAVGSTDIICRLTIAGITRADVGSGKGADEPLKAAATDAMKRAAATFGIGRHLKDAGRQWRSLRQGRPRGKEGEPEGQRAHSGPGEASPSSPAGISGQGSGESAADEAALPTLGKSWSELTEEEEQAYLREGHAGFRAFTADNGLMVADVLRILRVGKGAQTAGAQRSAWQGYINMIRGERQTDGEGAYRWALQQLLAALRRGAEKEGADVAAA